MLKTLLRAGASMALASGLAACAHSTATTPRQISTPPASEGINATGVTGQAPGTSSGNMRTNENAPAMPSLNETAPAQRNSTISQ